MSTRAITTLVTTCDRPRCNRVLSEREEGSDPPAEKEPDFLLKRTGKPDVRYPDLCDLCTKATDNLILGIEKKPRKKEDAPTVEPEPPAPVYWDPGNGEMVWVTGKVGVDSKAYSHKPASEDVVRIPALEGVTDPAEAGALIAAYEEAAE